MYALQLIRGRLKTRTQARVFGTNRQTHGRAPVSRPRHSVNRSSLRQRAVLKKSAAERRCRHFGNSALPAVRTRSRAADAADVLPTRTQKKCSAPSAAASPAASPTTSRPRRRLIYWEHHQVQNSPRPPTATSPRGTGPRPSTATRGATLIPRWPNLQEQQSWILLARMSYSISARLYKIEATWMTRRTATDAFYH